MGDGPLAGLRVVEFAGIGPAPFCAMLLSDMGADVVRVDRKGGGSPLGRFDVTARGRRSVAFDLKNPEAVDAALSLCDAADALVEGFRPGVMERLGLGPDVVLQRNPRLVYGRMTGWGQDGPLSQAAGHDLNYIALTGALHAIGPEDRPVPPLNLVGDYGGGALYLTVGVLAALLHAKRTGEGQVVDAAMTDGAASLMSVMYALKAAGVWDPSRRRANLLDGGAPYYDTYRCACGGFISVAAIEPQFYAVLREKAGLSADVFNNQNNRSDWPAMRQAAAEIFATKTRDEWCALLEGGDACFAPVLSMDEAPGHPHNRARGTFVERDDMIQPAPAPRFSRTPAEIQGPPAAAGAHTREVLAEWGVTPGRIEQLHACGAI